MTSGFTLGLPAPIARFVRAIFYAGVSAVLTAALANVGLINDFVVDSLSKLGIENAQTVAVGVVGVLTGLLQALDKFLRANGWLPEVLENK